MDTEKNEGSEPRGTKEVPPGPNGAVETSGRTSETLDPEINTNKSQTDINNTESNGKTTVSGAGANVEKDRNGSALGELAIPVKDTDKSTQNHMEMGPKMVLVMISLMLAVFCVALDNTIISVAIPSITDEFKRLDDAAWYLSAYLLTNCALQLFYGKLLSIFNTKWVFLAALVIFEVGSLVCGVATSSVVLIIGRAIAGIGCGGIFSGALLTLAHTLPLEKRPIFMGSLGGVYGIACVAGPLLGGIFTDELTWRWCFYINLPVGGVTLAVVLILLKLESPRKTQKSLSTTILEFDPAGTVSFISGTILLLLALQWGGVEYPWASWRIILLFAFSAVLLLGFAAIQIFFSQWATVPGRIIGQRSITAACLWNFTFGGSFFTLIFYIPIWFQAIHGTSAVKAGIFTLPMLLPQVAGAMTAGVIVTKIGYYAPLFIVSTVGISIGAGLCTLFSVDTPRWQWIVFQLVYGIGAGLGMQQPYMTAQTVLPLEDIPVGTALASLSQVFGGAVIVSAAQNVFTNRLIENLVALRLDGINPGIIKKAGATALRELVPQDRLGEVLVAYNDAIVKTFEISLIMACLSIIGAVPIEWRSVKGNKMQAEAA